MFIEYKTNEKKIEDFFFKTPSSHVSHCSSDFVLNIFTDEKFGFINCKASKWTLIEGGCYQDFHIQD